MIPEFIGQSPVLFFLPKRLQDLNQVSILEGTHVLRNRGIVLVRAEHCLVKVIDKLLELKEPAIEVRGKHLKKRAHLVDYLL